MKAVMMSVKTEGCEKIASGKQTIEVRKNRPKLETPFKVFIYCTWGRKRQLHISNSYSTTKSPYEQFWVGKPINDISKGRHLGNGKVIGEFVCDRIDHLVHSGTCRQDIQLTILNSDLSYSQLTKEYLRKTYLTPEGIEAYSNGGDVYAWHITDLVIYDKPKALEEFCILDKEKQKQCAYRERYYVNPDLSNGAALKAGFTCNLGHEIDFCRPFDNTCPCFQVLHRPPQSWCYVEEMRAEMEKE